MPWASSRRLARIRPTSCWAVARTVSLDSSHAFYLGYELAKATTALTLGKQYRQDEALNWGFLTIPEKSAHERRRHQAKDSADIEQS